MPSKVAGKTILSAEVALPRIGVWYADIVVDATELTGKVSIDLEGVTFVGTVLRSGEHGGRVGARIVGGAGGLSRDLPAKNYAGTPTLLSAILGDILRETGETVSPTAEAATLGETFQKWHRLAGPAKHSIQRLVDTAGADWRVLRDGTVWVGAATYPEAKPAHTLIDEDWVAGIITVATEKPELEPGVMFLGQRIELVIHSLTPSALRTEAHLTSASTSLDRFLARIRRDIDYSRIYPGTVVQQNGDGTLQVTPDNATVRGTGLDKVPIRHGLPGIKVENVPAGARVRVGWDNGDPAAPFAVLWDQDESAAQKMVLGTALLSWLANHVHPSGTGPTGVPTVPPLDAQLLSQILKLKGP